MLRRRSNNGMYTPEQRAKMSYLCANKVILRLKWRYFKCHISPGRRYYEFDRYDTYSQARCVVLLSSVSESTGGLLREFCDHGSRGRSLRPLCHEIDAWRFGVCVEHGLIQHPYDC